MITTGMRLVCRLSSTFSIASRAGWNGSERAIHRYVVAWLVALGLLLFIGPSSGPWALVAVGVAFYRLQDLVVSTLDDALGLTGRAEQFGRFSATTPILISLVNIVQVVLVFAIADLVLLGDLGRAFETAVNVSSRFDYLFLSWNSLPPLGSGYGPATAMARGLAITESATGMLIIVIAVTRFLSRGT